MMVGALRFIVVTALIGSWAGAQESVNTILDRGYVAHWLVCGPFASDMDGGIAGALQRGAAPLSTTDYLRPVGGVSRVRPSHLMKVQTGKGGVAIWQRAGAQSDTLDLAPFFPEASEGVAYAAFYAQSAREQTAYFDLETPLGARVWINGFLVREIQAMPVTEAGVDRFLAVFRPGVNLVIIEAPGASLGVLAEAAHLSESDFRAKGFANRPLLHGTSGYEIGLRVLPASPLGKIAYVPKLYSTGVFSHQGSHTFQQALLTFYNPARDTSPPITVTARFQGGAPSLTRIVNPIPSGAQAEATISVPVSGVGVGQPVNVDVTLEADDQKATFSSTLAVLAAPVGGDVYVVTGAHYVPEHPEDQRAFVQRRVAEIARQTALLSVEKGYGFDLGTAEAWKPFWDSNPEMRNELVRAVAHGRCAAHAAFAVVDERIAGAELLARNIIYGNLAARYLLGGNGDCYYAWNTPGLCFQTPQLLAKASLDGIVSNLKLPGIPGLSWQLALDGERVLHRRKRGGPGVVSVAALRDAVAVQRRELLHEGFDCDILVARNVMEPPEPFYLGACSALAQSTPAIHVTGDGGREFFASALDQIKRASLDVPTCGRDLLTYRPGDLVAQTCLKQAFARAQSATLKAETFGAMASLIGAVYPEVSLDFAWRQLLFAANPKRVGFSETPQNFADTLAACQQASGFANGVQDRATRYIASQVDTYADAPSKVTGAFAVVVFNPSSWKRTDVCVVDAKVKGIAGLKLTDNTGKAVPYSADFRRDAQGATVARIRFVASDVPSLGYRTYFAEPAKYYTGVRETKGVQIENEYFIIVADAERGGAVVSLKDRKSGVELVRSLLNDILAIDENPAKNHHGHDLWTTGGVTRASGGRASISVRRTGYSQRLVVSAPFLGGRVVRTLTLYAGVPRIDCETRFEGVSAKDSLLAASFGVAADGCAVVYGDRFGAVVGHRGRKPWEYRTDSGKNLSGTGLRPALDWFAASPNDHLRIGMNIAVPLAPTTIVYGREPALERAAREMQAAFVGRGIPCSISPDEPRPLNPVWTDSTEFPNRNGDLNYGAALRIVLGNTTQNDLCRDLCQQLDPGTLSKFKDRMANGAILYMYDKDVPSGYRPEPTLLLAAETTTPTVTLASAITDSVRGGGVIQIPPGSSTLTDGKPQPNAGLAALFNGAALAGLEPDGTMVLALRHRSGWTGEARGVPASLNPDSDTFRYALYPFAGTWRDAAVPRAARAYAAPFCAVAEPLHLAKLPWQLSFLSVSDPNFIVTAFKPEQYRAVELSSEDIDPAYGITVRGYESVGQRWEGNLSLFTGLRAAARTDLLNHLTDNLGFSGKAAKFTCGGYSIETFSLLPSVIGLRGPSSNLDEPKEDVPMVFTRYWLHNSGAAPPGFGEISVALSGDLSEQNASVQLAVANNRSDAPARGVVSLTASSGWSVAPAQVEYDLKPGECAVTRVVALRDNGGDSSGGIIARTEFNGRSYLDVLEKNVPPATLEGTRSGNEIHVVIKNPGSLRIIGYLDVIAPDTISASEGGAIRPSVTPRRTPISVGPYRERRVVILTRGLSSPRWIVLRLATNDHVRYAFVGAGSDR